MTQLKPRGLEESIEIEKVNKIMSAFGHRHRVFFSKRLFLMAWINKWVIS
jgi:hypothetical protein